jgi:pyrimidine operon attenuation protein/uracil phosphoribosyltransferase
MQHLCTGRIHAAPRGAEVITMCPSKGTAKSKPAAAAPARKSVKKSAAKGAKPKAEARAKAAIAEPVTERLLGPREVASAIKTLAGEIAREFPDPTGLVILGIQRHGVVIARRLRELLEKGYKAKIGFGVLDITLYRDDLLPVGPQPQVGESEIPFDITGTNVVLVDDVLYTGRTVRAALDEIVDFGRPQCIRLVALVDRGHREYPIQGDYVGHRMETGSDQHISVRMKELDNEDGVFSSVATADSDAG